MYERARLAAEVAEQALASGPWLAGQADHVAAGLHVESIGWSLRALSDSERPDVPPVPPSGPPRSAELEALLEAHRDTLHRLLPLAREREQFQSWMLNRTFESVGAPVHEVRRAALLLSRIARYLLRELTPARPLISTLRWQRLLRCTAVLLVMASAPWLVHAVHELREVRADLCAGRPWRASSSFVAACASPHHHCSSASSYFFHTREEASPWLELDLQAQRRFSRVHVFNRSDCCSERAVPLIVEVSSDGVHYREVQRRDQPFVDWTATFTPTTARWVRLRAAHTTFLHLRDVRVLD